MQIFKGIIHNTSRSNPSVTAAYIFSMTDLSLSLMKIKEQTNKAIFYQVAVTEIEFLKKDKSTAYKDLHLEILNI